MDIEGKLRKLTLDPFGHLKHKLWSKEGPEVKLPNWFPTTKSQESPWFPCVQVACNIPLKSSWRGLQCCFRLHFDQRFAHKIMALQSCRSPNFGNFRLSLGSPETKCHLDVGPVASHRVYYKGKVEVSPKSRPWWVLWVRVCPWWVLTPKVFQLCINQLVLWFCAGSCERLSVCHLS